MGLVFYSYPYYFNNKTFSENLSALEKGELKKDYSSMPDDDEDDDDDENNSRAPTPDPNLNDDISMDDDMETIDMMDDLLSKYCL